MINFLTSNKKKASDFQSFGFGVKEFLEEIPEIKSENVLEVALHKAKDTGLNNVVVEDTALYIKGLDFYGTDIKHLYDEIKSNNSYDGYQACWMVCLCMKKDNIYYLASGELNGKLNYPGVTNGYHFENILAVEKNGSYVPFPSLSKEEQHELSPRYQALKKLAHAIKNEDYTNLIQINANNVKTWHGEYQIETTQKQVAYRI
jgi:inosine/xanthosine triphosphate pyrophosphatase family protein